MEWDNELEKYRRQPTLLPHCFFLAVQDSATPKSLFLASTIGRYDAGLSKLSLIAWRIVNSPDSSHSNRDDQLLLNLC